MTTLKNILNIKGVGLLFLISVITSCGLEKESSAIDELNVRIPADPERLNPMLSSSGYATQIEDHIFMSLFAQDPATLEYVPMLAAGKPIVKEGPLFNEKRSTAYTYTIREEAEWSDGRPVTAEDYIFSIKLALNPYVASASWKGFLQFFMEAEADSDNQRIFTAYADRDYMHSMEITSSFAIYPKHLYDPDNLLSSFSIPELKNYREDSLPPAKENLLKQLADEFQTARFSTQVVEGAGPYRLVEYESGQRITLAKKENWWGADLLDAGPEKINYFIIADESVALSALKEGSIDVMSEISPVNFKDLKSDPQTTDRLHFHTPPLLQIYYIAINNEDPKFRDPLTRRALAHLIDLEFLTGEIMEGYAEAVPSVLHPADPNFNPELTPLSYSPSKANLLLAEAGWEDTDDDGVLDRIIDGEKVDLKIQFDVSSGELGQQIALLFKESAEKLGIPVDINRREFRLIRQDLQNKNYDMSPLVLRQNLFKTDLYQNWHTNSNKPGGNNVAGYSNPAADAIMEQIRLEKDDKKLRSLYAEVQEIIYRDQPVIFLVAPKERLAFSKNINMTVSAVRPGYFEYTAQPVD